MTPQADTSSKTSVLSHKQRRKSSLLCASSTKARSLGDLENNCKNWLQTWNLPSIYTRSWKTTSSDVHHMYWARSARYPGLPGKHNTKVNAENSGHWTRNINIPNIYHNRQNEWLREEKNMIVLESSIKTAIMNTIVIITTVVIAVVVSFIWHFDFNFKMGLCQVS